MRHSPSVVEIAGAEGQPSELHSFGGSDRNLKRRPTSKTPIQPGKIQGQESDDEFSRGGSLTRDNKQTHSGRKIKIMYNHNHNQPHPAPKAMLKVVHEDEPEKPND
jgi:hypothetical protein